MLWQSIDMLCFYEADSACICRLLLVEEKKDRNSCSKFWSLENLELAKQVSLNDMFTSSSPNITVQQYPLQYCDSYTVGFCLAGLLFNS